MKKRMLSMVLALALCLGLLPGEVLAAEQKIVTGKGYGILDPKGNASRAEVATMLMRYCESPVSR